MDLKTCVKCKLQLPFDQFNKNKSVKKDGLQSLCKGCCKIYVHENKEQIRITRLKWESSHSEEEKIRLKLRHENNRERRNEQSRMYRAKKKLLKENHDRKEMR